MVKSKRYYSDRVRKDLQDAFPNIDTRTFDEREIFLTIDDVVNSMAKLNYMENWKMLSGIGVDEQFITEWSGVNAITVIQTSNDSLCYLEFPAQYAALQKNGGIVEVWPENYAFGAVRIMDRGDARKTRRLMSGNLQGELGGYPKHILGSTPILEFNQTAVKEKYGPTFGMRLVVHDSSLISVTAPYPIPADLQEEVIKRSVLHFKERRLMPTDAVRDKQDAINRN